MNEAQHRCSLCGATWVGAHVCKSPLPTLLLPSNPRVAALGAENATLRAHRDATTAAIYEAAEALDAAVDDVDHEMECAVHDSDIANGRPCNCGMERIRAVVATLRGWIAEQPKDAT